MIISLILMALITAGGVGLTYLWADDEPLMRRIAAGCVVGSAVFGTAGFLLASLAGLSVATAAAMFVLLLLPLLILRSGSQRREFHDDWNSAKNRVQGTGLRRALPFVYYSFFFLLFLFFFERTMFVRDGAILTGGSNNLGDLPFHLGAIFSFTEGANFPPENPNFAGAKFTYPFVADLITAFFVKLGADVKDAMLVQNVAWAFSLLIILQRFVLKMVKDTLASRIAPFLLFFSGGLGFIWFVGDYWDQSKSLWEFLNALPKDYTIGPDFRWGNSLTTLFITQRSLLLGMPITLVVLSILWGWFNSDGSDRTDTSGPRRGTFDRSSVNASVAAAGLIAGTLVLIHLHSLFVLFVVCVCLLILRPNADLITRLGVFGVFVAAVAVPELIWSMTGSATETGEFVSRHFGWDSGQMNIVWFWIKNTGLFIPLLATGIYLLWPKRVSANTAEEDTKQKSRTKRSANAGPAGSLALLLFYVPFVVIFLLSNVFKFAPWEWDNIKLLIYWWVGSIPFAAYAIAYVWKRGPMMVGAASVLILLLTFSGALDVWRVVSEQINYGVFDKDAVEIANEIRIRSDANTRILNAPTYNTAAVLTGRDSLLRYPGHLSSHGINYGERLSDARTIYSGGAGAEQLLTKHGIDLVLLGPEVQAFAQEPGSRFAVNEEFFKRFPLLVQTSKYKVYKVK